MSHPDLLHTTAYWDIFAAPLIPGARLHFKLAPHVQVDDLLDLPDVAFHDYWTALAWIKDGYDLTYYVTVTRCGDPRYTGGSDPYACVYVVVGDPESDVVVKHPISSAKEDR